MKYIEQKTIRLASVITLYICLLFGSICIYQNKIQQTKSPLDEIISREKKIYDYLQIIISAQQKYHEVDWDEDGKKEYAQFLAHLWVTVDKNANQVDAGFIPKKLAFAICA